MRRGIGFIFLALILIVGLGVGYFVYTNYMKAPANAPVAELPTPTPITTEPIVLVVQPIEVGSVITADMLKLENYPKDFITPNMFRNIEDAVGMRAKFSIDPPMPLTMNMVTESQEAFLNSGSDDALLIPRGRVSVSIPIDRLTSVSFAPRRGDHVNVIVTLLLTELDSEFQSELPNVSGSVIIPSFLEGQPSKATSDIIAGGGQVGRSVLDPAFESPFYVLPSEQQRARMVSQTLIQNAIVLQMGLFETEEKPVPTPTLTAEQAAAAQGGEPTPVPTPTAPPPPPDLITLIVSPQDAVTLNYLIFHGAKITLALRNPLDGDPFLTEAVTLQFLLDQYAIPIPAKLPYGLEPRVDNFQPYVAPATATPAP